MKIDQRQFDRIKKIFDHRFKKSLNYAKEKQRLIKYFKGKVKRINSKLKGHQLGHNIGEFLTNIKGNDVFSDHDVFMDNANQYRGASLLKRKWINWKLNEEEGDFLWILHTKNFEEKTMF